MLEYIGIGVIFVILYVVYLVYDFRKTEREVANAPKPKGPPNPEKLGTLKETSFNLFIDYDSLRSITLDELHQNDGRQRPTVWIGIKNMVFDVSTSEAYRPDGSYGVFAGQDASIALGKMDLSGKYLNEYGAIQDASEIQIMNDWVGYFYQRYPVVAKISDKKLE